MITKKDRKHTFQIGMCALICIVISSLIFVNHGAKQLGFVLFHINTIFFVLWYLKNKYNIYKLTNLYITEEQLLYLGFTKLPHFTIGNMKIKDLGRNRYLSIQSLGTPNEMLFICYKGDNNSDFGPSDNIVLHNYDYDGYLTFNQLKKYCTIVPKTDENGFSRKRQTK